MFSTLPKEDVDIEFVAPEGGYLFRQLNLLFNRQEFVFTGVISFVVCVCHAGGMIVVHYVDR